MGIRPVTLDEGEHVIGRDPNAEVYLDALGVSRHAQIKIAAARATIEDLGARMGRLSGSASRRLPIDWRWRRRNSRFREADGQGDSGADFD